MQQITIGFVDFWVGFQPENNRIVDILSEKYQVNVIRPEEERHTPDFLFFSTFGRSFLRYDCIRIFITGENVTPDFNLCDYALGFDYLQFGDRYMRYPIFLWRGYQEEFQRLIENRRMDDAPEKRDFCSFVVSNNKYASPFRIELFQKLNEYRAVASGGRLYNNIGKPNGVEDKTAFLQQYKFHLAVENVSYEGYMTEKIMDAFFAGTVPIYWGDCRVSEVIDPESFIDCTGLTTEEAVQKVAELDQDDQKYLSMLGTFPLRNRMIYQETEQRLREFLLTIIARGVAARRRPQGGMMALYVSQMGESPKNTKSGLSAILLKMTQGRKK